jgi:Right handed beta helix region
MCVNKYLPSSLFVLLVLAACFASQTAQATSTAVGLCSAPGVHYTTIQAAVNAVSAGGTVEVCPGTYPEQITISKNLTLKGVVSGTSDEAVVLPPSGGIVANGTDIYGSPVAAQILVQNASAVTISHLTVDGTGNNFAGCSLTTFEGIAFDNASGKITDNVVRNQYQTDFTDYGGCQNGLAINVESLTNSYTVAVSGNSVRAYQKNGITASGAATGPGSPGPAVTITTNYVTGLAATAMNWPGGAGANGIQVGFGATGTIASNVVNDNLWYGEYPPNYGGQGGTTTGNGASGILVYASSGIQITSNIVGSAQFGITTNTDPSYGSGDDTYIESNRVTGTQVFDAIDLCSNSNTAKSNIVYGSAQSAVHIDDSCSGSGNSNNVINNTINEACAGILLGTGTGNTYSPNTFFVVSNTTMAGDTCTPAAGQVKQGELARHSSSRPSPYKPNRK